MKYPYNVYPLEANGHSIWVAESLSLKGCVGQGDTPDEACSELSQNENDWLETADELGIPIPERPNHEVKAFSAPSLRILAWDLEKKILTGAYFIVKDACGKTTGTGKVGDGAELFLENGAYTVFLSAPDCFSSVRSREIRIVDARGSTSIVEFFCEPAHQTKV